MSIRSYYPPQLHLKMSSKPYTKIAQDRGVKCSGPEIKLFRKKSQTSKRRTQINGAEVYTYGPATRIRVVVVHRYYYTTLKVDQLYKKILTWLGEEGLSSQLPVLEYRSTFPGLAAHLTPDFKTI
ncbi:hypothetical protein CHS0354_007362 [Potamilus streckersoni]|uniref:Uncharacterized protein n=1 Tax=Potamilus streckersoni TaxID=2493646 RepID=A0AAE0TJK7_9BIVA|nr:hypothetical protein CHS0354_007362 [Potamilus streckersoni]